jgi:hypothetical protein
MTATAPAAGSRETTDTGHRTMYWIVGGVVVALCVIGLIAYSAEQNNQEAQQKAQQLTQKFKAAGLPVPADTDTIVNSLGTDGGAVCDNPGKALGKATLLDQLTNGADFVGRRPVIIDRRFLVGELLILQTYCPGKAGDYQDAIKDLKTDNVIKGG